MTKNIKNKLVLSIIYVTFLLSNLKIINDLTTVSAQNPSISINRVVWGTNLNTPEQAYAGALGQLLTVEAKNLLSSNITGIVATLVVEYPFSDSYDGDSVLNASGAPAVYGGSPIQQVGQTGEIRPGGLFTLTFSIDIDEEAVAQAYIYNVEVNYNIEPSFSLGSTLLSVKLVVSKASTTVSCDAAPQSIEKGESIDITGSVTPARENVTVILLYKRPNGSVLSRTVTTAADGSYKDSYRPDLEGIWNLNASWTGDSRYKGDWASESFEVTLPVSLTLSTSGTQLVGGMDNTLNITLLNSGGAPLSSIDATLTISAPLILKGSNHWTFKNLNATDSIIIPLIIFSPSTNIGTTSQGQLQISYRDSYGQSHIDTHPIGLRIVGHIELVVYGKSVNPNPSSPGSKVTITATILNKGNVIAKYGNASLALNSVLELFDESITYIGDIEENSPMPFTVSATVKSGTANGTYPVKILLLYQDDQYHDHSFDITMTLTVAASQPGQSNPSNSGGIVAFLEETGLTIVALAAASVGILFIYRRRISKRFSKSGI